MTQLIRIKIINLHSERKQKKTKNKQEKTNKTKNTKMKQKNRKKITTEKKIWKDVKRLVLHYKQQKINKNSLKIQNDE